MDLNDFWDSDNYYDHPVLTEYMIDEAERLLGVKLPISLIALLRVKNGGYTNSFAYPMNAKTSWSDNHIPLDELYGIVPKDIGSPMSILLTLDMTEEWGLPNNQVLLSGDGHWFITLDYRESSNPSVRWIDTEMNEDIHIADSFEEFIEGLVSEEEFTD